MPETPDVQYIPTNFQARSTLFTKKWTKGRRNKLNVSLFIQKRIENKKRAIPYVHTFKEYRNEEQERHDRVTSHIRNATTSNL